MVDSAGAEEAIIFPASTVHLIPTEGLTPDFESVIIARTISTKETRPPRIRMSLLSINVFEEDEWSNTMQ